MKAEEGSHPSGTTRSHRLLWVGAIGAIALVLVGWVAVRWWTAEPWTGMEKSLATYPVPTGWQISSGPSRDGYRPAERFIAPDYQPAIEELVLSPTGSSPDPCGQLHASLAGWARQGFDETGPLTTGDAPCGVEGEIDGHRVEAFVEMPAGEDDPVTPTPEIVVRLHPGTSSD